MLCILETPIDLAMWVKLHNLIRNNKGARNGKTVVDLLDRVDLKTMVAGEKLTLVSHGNETSFGGFDVDDLAKKLLARGLRSDLASIKLSGCKSGSDAKGTPFCTSLARRLYDLTKHLPKPVRLEVTGFVNTAVTFPDGTVRSKIPDKAPAQGPKYAEIIDKYKKTGEFAQWSDLALKLPHDTEQHIIESAEQMAKLSNAMFDELYAMNGQVIYGKKEGKFRHTWT
jgi:hypothetical protein